MIEVNRRKIVVLSASAAIIGLATLAITSAAIIKYFHYNQKTKKIQPSDLALLEVQGLLSSSREVLDAETKLYIAEQRLDSHRTSGNPEAARWETIVETKRKEADDYLTQYCTRLSRLASLDFEAVQDLLQKALADTKDPRELSAFRIAQKDFANYKKDSPKPRDSIRSEFRSIRNR